MRRATAAKMTVLTRKVDQAEPIERKHRPHISTVKILSIQKRHLAGQSNREIARAERCGRSTVASVVRAPDLQQHLQQVRERVWGMADNAADVLFESIVEGRDPRIAYELLRDVGVLPRASQIVYDPNGTSPSTQERRQDQMAHLIGSVMLNRHKVFGVEFPPDVQEVLDQKEAEDGRDSDHHGHGSKESGIKVAISRSRTGE